VVLLTGLDNDMSVWDQTRQHLDDISLCAYDRANLGSSDYIEGPRPIHDSVDELHGFLQAAEVPPPYILVGHSYGGLVSMLYAAAYPQKVDSLLLVDGLLPFEDELDAIANGPRELAIIRAELNDNSEQLRIFGHLPDADTLVGSLPDVPTVYLFGRRQDLTEPGWPPGSYRTRMQAFIQALPNGAIVKADAGHGIPVEDPTAIARQVTALHRQ
jgi:pimeloyl-ACP methyl ester carboxylesterase